MALPLSRQVRALPGVSTGIDVVQSIIELPRTLDRLSRALGSLDRLAQLDETLRTLSTFSDSLERIALLSDSVEKLSAAVEILPELSASAASLPELTQHASALAALTVHAEALTELTKHAESLPELTRHAAALPELAPRVASVELMVQSIIEYLESLQPTVRELTIAAADLQRSVGPIGRIAGRLPGSKLKEAPVAQIDSGTDAALFLRKICHRV
jgi:methyl-accepting chemotaxis protein